MLSERILRKGQRATPSARQRFFRKDKLEPRCRAASLMGRWNSCGRVAGG